MSEPGPPDLEQLRKALDDIKEWFVENDRGQIVADLCPGAPAAALDRVEERCGARLPVELRELFTQHDGQRARGSAWFFGRMNFVGVDAALQLRPSMLSAYFGVIAPGVVKPETIFCAEATPLRDAELDGRWFPFANDEGDFLAAHLGTGRVYRVLKGEKLRLEAASVSAFLCDFADKLWNENYDEAEDGKLLTV